MFSRRTLLKSGLAAFSSLSLPSALASAQGYGIAGKQAPELKVNYWIDTQGNETEDTFRLSDHQGKWVFLKCFQSWCPGCHSHGLPAVKKISDALADNPEVVFAGIQTVFEGRSVNTIDKVIKTQKQYGLNFPMGHDPGVERSLTMIDYRTGGTPWMILISPSRQVVYNDFSINADKAIEFLQQATASPPIG
ncbi:MAG: redoxin domain-containing protein [Gammaproteobacteria bacterium]|nr:redoxin domain-containing protein [Gammaproteobacteria bacterium]